MGKKGLLRYEPRDVPEEILPIIQPSLHLTDSSCPGVGYRVAETEGTERRVHATYAPGSLGRAGVFAHEGEPKWLAKRKHDDKLDRHHQDYDNEVEFAAGSRQLSIVVANFGNLDRMGTNIKGVQTETLLQGYLTGSFHLVILQEASSCDLWRNFNTWNFAYLTGQGDKPDNIRNGLLVAAGGSGIKVWTRLLDKEYTNPFATTAASKALTLSALHARIAAWQDPQTGNAVQRAGRYSWVAISFHLNNVVAKKKEVVKQMAQKFWEDVFKYDEIVIIGGDVNGGIAEFEGVGLEKAQEKGCDMYRAQSAKDDCLWIFVVFPPDQQKHFHVKTSTEQKLKAADLQLRRSDADAHHPLLTHISNLQEPRRKSRRMPKTVVAVKADNERGSSSSAGPLPVGLVKRSTA